MITEPYYFDKLGKLPSKPKFDKHYWADYIELKCIINKDGLVTIDDFLDSYHSRSTDLNEGALEEDDDEETLTTNNNSKGDLDDREKIFAEDIFRVLSSRVKIFKEFYPFTISEDNRLIAFNSETTLERKNYIFLLLCSALNYFDSDQSDLTQSFEVLSLKILEQLLPSRAEAHLFGSNNSLIENRRFTGNLWTKINALASALKEIVKGSEDDYPPTDSGDGGLDLIGWFPKDSLSHKFIFTGQSGCTPDWDIKQFSSGYSAWKNKIAFSVTPINIVFIPYAVRNHSDRWHRGTDIGDAVMMDRRRILDHLQDNELINKLPCINIINSIISNKESAFN